MQNALRFRSLSTLPPNLASNSPLHNREHNLSSDIFFPDHGNMSPLHQENFNRNQNNGPYEEFPSGVGRGDYSSSAGLPPLNSIGTSGLDEDGRPVVP